MEIASDNKRCASLLKQFRRVLELLKSEKLAFSIFFFYLLLHTFPHFMWIVLNLEYFVNFHIYTLFDGQLHHICITLLETLNWNNNLSIFIKLDSMIAIPFTLQLFIFIFLFVHCLIISCILVQFVFSQILITYNLCTSHINPWNIKIFPFSFPESLLQSSVTDKQS